MARISQDHDTMSISDDDDFSTPPRRPRHKFDGLIENLNRQIATVSLSQLWHALLVFQTPHRPSLDGIDLYLS